MKLMEKLKALGKALKPIKVLLGILATIVALILSLGQICDRYCSREIITLEYSPPSPVSVQTKVTLRYTLPDKGYFSLWNIDGQGKFYRILPEPSQTESSVKLNKNNHIGFRILDPDTARSKEEMLALWTKEHDNHPPNIEYPTEKAFRRYLTLYPNHWVEKKATLQIK